MSGTRVEQVAPGVRTAPPPFQTGAGPVAGSRLPSPPSPATPPPVALKRRRAWRPGLLSIGALLVAGSMLGGILLFDSVTTTTSVLVAAADLEPGTVLEVGDVRVADVSVAPGINVLTLDEQRFLGGDAVGEPVRVLRGFVPAGTILSEDHFMVRSQAIAPGEALVGVRLEVGDYPPSLAVGDVVEVFAVRPSSSSAAPGDADTLTLARVWRVWQSVDGSGGPGELVADLVIGADVQPAVVQAQADGRLRLTVLPGAATPEPADSGEGG